MTTILRFIEVFALGTWVGAILFLSFAIAPGAFAVLPAREQAGAVVNMALGRLYLFGYIAAALFLIARIIRLRSLAALIAPAVILVLLMVVLTLLSQYWVGARMSDLRAEMKTQMGSIDSTPADHPLRIEFNRLHSRSVQLTSGVLLLGLAALFLTVRQT